MKKWDVNCFVGHWPFRKSRFTTLGQLKEKHQRNGISQGFVSSLQSVFWNDPMEAEEDLAGELSASGYAQICTVNPMLPDVERFVEEAVRRFQVKGVRLCPSYHGYRLDDPCLESLNRTLERLGLPLYITVQLEDPRMNYVVFPRELELEELKVAAEVFPEINVLYCFIQEGDAAAMAELLNTRKNLYVDTSGFRGPSCCMEKLLESVDSHKILYGSAYTLYALNSSLGCVEQADISDEIKQRILWENAVRFFRLS